MRQVAPTRGKAHGGMAKDKKVQLSDEFTRSSLARCVEKHDPQLALLCLEQGESPFIRCKTTGCTLYHAICIEASPLAELKYVPLVYVLSNAGLDPDLPDLNDVTPLQLAIKCGLLEIMTALLKCGAQCRGNEEQLAERHGGLFSSEFITTLRRLWPGYWQSVQDGNTFRVNKLAKSWVRINVSRGGQSLIEFAKTTARPGDDPKLVRHLVDNEASVELAHAVMAGDENRMDLFLRHHAASVTTRDLSHRDSFLQPYSPLSLYGAALKYGHKHLLAALRSATFTDCGPHQQQQLQEDEEAWGDGANGEGRKDNGVGEGGGWGQAGGVRTQSKAQSSVCAVL